MAMPRVILVMLILNTLVLVGSVVSNYLLLKPLTQAGAVALAAGGEAGGEGEPGAIEEAGEYSFFPVQKVIVSLRGEQREHYFVLDLVLQADEDTDKKKLEQADPMVRSSAVAFLSALPFDELRALAIPELQERLEKALLDDFAARRVVAPFQHVLVSKLIVQ